MNIRAFMGGSRVTQLWALLCILLWCSAARCEIGEATGGVDSDTALEDGEVADEVVEEINEVDVVETVELVETSGEASTTGVAGVSSTTEVASFSFVKLLGRLHPAFVHLPLGLLIALLVLEISTRTKPCSAGKWIWGITVVSFLPAALSGFLRANEILAMGGQTDVGSHRNWMIIAFVTLIAGAALKMNAMSRNSQSAQWASAGLVALATIMAFWGAHLGGKLVYGSEFLPF